MKTTYIQFEVPTNSRQTKKDGLLTKIFAGILTKIIPEANPDFEKILDEVKYWVVECDSESGIPQREIGLDQEGRIILKMPYKENYGYWIDNHLLLNDFREHFATSEIDREIFERKWDMFDVNQMPNNSNT